MKIQNDKMDDSFYKNLAVAIQNHNDKWIFKHGLWMCPKWSSHHSAYIIDHTIIFRTCHARIRCVCALGDHDSIARGEFFEVLLVYGKRISE